MKDQLTQSESLAIISEMIETAKKEFKGNQFFFIFWGWLAIAIHLAHYYLIVYTDVTHPELVWCMSIVGGIYTAIYSMRKGKKQRAVSHLDKAIGLIWMAYGFTLLIVIGAGNSIYPLITTITALPTFASGVLIRYRPLIYCGSLFWIFGTVSFMVSPTNQILVGAVALLFGYLLPGYLMKTSK